MEAFFLLSVTSSSADSSSLSLSESGGSLFVGDTDGDGGAGWDGADDGPLFLSFFWASCLAGSLSGTGAGSLWCPPQWQRQRWQQQKQQQQQSGDLGVFTQKICEYRE